MGRSFEGEKEAAPDISPELERDIFLYFLTRVKAFGVDTRPKMVNN